MFHSLSSEAWLARVYVAFYGCVKPWMDDFASCVQPLDVAYDVGLSSGDIEYAMVGFSMSVQVILFLCAPEYSLTHLCS
jgi:hypothetical protein